MAIFFDFSILRKGGLRGRLFLFHNEPVRGAVYQSCIEIHFYLLAGLADYFLPVSFWMEEKEYWE